MTGSGIARPSLLERLSGASAADAHDEGRRCSATSDLRNSVRRELTRIFNATAISATHDLARFPHVARCALNYGLPDLSGKTASSIDRPKLEAQLARAMRDFEPRLRPGTSRVSLGTRGPVAHNTLAFDITGEIDTGDGAAPLAFHTEFDLESGKAKVTEMKHRS